MSSGGFYLGIDTSNYKTSTAVIDETGVTAAELSEFLDVPEGKRGLRQSEAFFKHSVRLPEHTEKLFSCIDPALIKAIGVSEKPRRLEGSYMPCFLAGTNLAKELGSALKVPVYFFSHQEGHAAAVVPENEASEDRFLFMHLSGGTTEFILARADEYGYDMKIVGGTKDISVGQLLDRFGVALGMPFPAGSYLDEIAFKELNAQKEISSSHKMLPKIKVSEGAFNLSGAETRLLRFAGSDEANDRVILGAVCGELFMSIYRLLLESANELSSLLGVRTVYLAGGAASSKTIRMLFENNSGDIFPGLKILFGDAKLSGDNAVGIARLAKRLHETGNSNTGK
ncbi:MAG: DNA-binding protein [Mogibacterium sp.]|nr:DNA-binding protein [Mogibacterium sp.]